MKTPFKLLSLVLAALTFMSASSVTFAAPIENLTYKKVLKYGLIGAGIIATVVVGYEAYKFFGLKDEVETTCEEKEIEINSEEDFEQIKNCRDTITKAIINIEEIAPNVFEYCSNLKEVDLHEVKSIGNNAFVSCLKLTTVKNTSDVQNIGKFAFCNCVALKEIDLPNASEIKIGAFFNCKSLNKISLPSVKLILNDVFTNCSSLENVTLPKNSKNLEEIISSQKSKNENSGEINFIYK